MFTRAIVRTPGRSLINGLSSSVLGEPNYHKALVQHADYITALQTCGLDVEVLPPWEEYPDSCFLEDAALLTPHCAVITRPGAPTRRGETEGLADVLGAYYRSVEKVAKPGSVEGGDILMVGSHFYIGLSGRTNLEGANQIIKILNQHHLTGSTIPLRKILHLKTGIAYLEKNTLIAFGELLKREEFSQFKILQVPEEENYAANCIWVNGQVLVPAGFPSTSGLIRDAGYSILEVDVSEFRKLDGGLSCLSLRF